MPDLPRIFSQPNIPYSGVVQTTPQQFGAGVAGTLGNVFNVVRKQKDAEDLLAIQDAVDQRDQLYRDEALKARLDPDFMGSLTADQFIKRFNTQAKDGDNRVLSQLPANVKPHAAIQLRKLQKTAFDAQFNDYRNTYVDQQRAKVITRRDDLINKIAESNEPAKSFYASELQASFDGAQAAGIFNATEIVNEKRYSNNQIMSLEARQSPIDFMKKEARGDFKNRDAIGVQTALDIAGKTLDLAARRDAIEGKALSDAAERGFELQASERKLNVDELTKAARLFGWSKDKVDGLLRMQIGVKIANPYESQIIEDALKPVDSTVRPNAGQIGAAYNNLIRSVQNREISPDTAEYRSAIRRLQSLQNNLDVKADIAESRSEFDARQSIADLYRRYYPKKDNKAIISERASHYRAIDALPANQRRQYVKELEQEFERKQQQSPGPKIDYDTLRGIPRR